jgi:methylenetetrahydrofolate reductase (NADPH)
MSQVKYENKIREVIGRNIFLYTLEYVPEIRRDNRDQVFRELTRIAEPVGRDARICGVNIGDRVKSMNSYDTVECGAVAAAATGKMPLLHLAGKGRTPFEARSVLTRAKELGLDNYLLLTGDGVTEPTDPSRVPYHDAINAIVDAKAISSTCFIATAISPFKYREEELMNQYLKMMKKINLGTNYLITNVGWDMDKLAELIWYRNRRRLSIPVVANLLFPYWAWAKGIHAKRLPGVYMSDDLFQKLTEEREQPDRGESLVYNRLALQVLGVKLMGYSGVHLSGVHEYESLCRIIELVDELEKKISTLVDWKIAWSEANRLADGRLVRFAPANGFYLTEEFLAGISGKTREPEGVSATTEEVRKYNFLRGIHHFFFEEGALGNQLMGPVVKAADWHSSTRAILNKLEHGIKAPILGCEMCGFCRIPHLSYVCPETCPKGLANGPCAGTSDNICEFKDRECIHNKKYRLAKATGRLSDLEEVIIPPVENTRNTSSWANQYRGSIPRVSRIASQADKNPASLDTSNSGTVSSRIAPLSPEPSEPAFVSAKESPCPPFRSQ